MTLCQAEVRHLIYQSGQRYRGSTGSRQINEYAFSQCSREALVEVEMYPPRDAPQAMHPIKGRVCTQHSRKWFPRMAAGILSHD